MGETGRSVYERMLDHWDDWGKKKEGSSLWKHSVNEHGGLLDDDKFHVKVLRRPRTALERQVLEGVLIEEEKLEELLNSKSEWGHNRVPRIRVEVGNFVVRDEDRGQLEDDNDKEEDNDRDDNEDNKDDDRTKTGNKRGGMCMRRSVKRQRLGTVGDVIVEEENVIAVLPTGGDVCSVTSSTATEDTGGGSKKEYVGTIWGRMMERARSMAKEERGRPVGGNKRGRESQGEGPVSYTHLTLPTKRIV